MTHLVAAVLGMFTLYTGVALAVALFHPDAGNRRHAAAVLRQLLGFWRPR
jgi:hypothetical protein